MANYPRYRVVWFNRYDEEVDRAGAPRRQEFEARIQAALDRGRITTSHKRQLQAPPDEKVSLQDFIDDVSAAYHLAQHAAPPAEQ